MPHRRGHRGKMGVQRGTARGTRYNKGGRVKKYEHGGSHSGNMMNNSCPPGQHMMPNGQCMMDSDMPSTGGRMYEHGGSHCGPGMMYQNGGCVSMQHGGSVSSLTPAQQNGMMPQKGMSNRTGRDGGNFRPRPRALPLRPPRPPGPGLPPPDPRLNQPISRYKTGGKTRKLRRGGRVKRR
tara:strand:+ start:4189 stop:4728 length:540 start_codon:yes stop_codon:yes gene_type:complete